jgi:oxalate decarboxylase/phosphoglucose isomerase-like protein (cupin superfamily)
MSKRRCPGLSHAMWWKDAKSSVNGDTEQKTREHYDQTSAAPTCSANGHRQLNPGALRLRHFHKPSDWMSATAMIAQ